MFGFIAELWRRLRTPSIKSVAERVDAIVEQRRTKTRYALGGANPVRTYTSISGPEMDVYFAESDKLVPYAQIHGVSFENVIEDGAPVVRGTLVALVFDTTPFVLGEVFKRMVLQWRSEFGPCSYLEVLDLEITKVSTGVSVDDITTDVVYEFKARGEVAWRRGELVTLRVTPTLCDIE